MAKPIIPRIIRGRLFYQTVFHVYFCCLSRACTRQRKLYFDLIVAPAPSLPNSPEGLCHPARDIANVAFMKRQTRGAS